MKHTGLLKLMAALPLVIWSCSKAGFVSEEIPAPEAERDPWAIIPIEPTAATGGPATLTAVGDETKSQLVVDESSARVVWSSGDAFFMVGHTNKSTSIQGTTYSTLSGGESAVFSTPEAIEPGKEHYYSYYPLSAVERFALSDDGVLMAAVTFPHNQVANPGNLAENANLSFAHSTEPVPENLSFTNAGAIIKFRLSGTVVSQIKKVSFMGGEYLSGTVLIKPNGNYVEVLPGLYYADLPRYTSVSLSLTGGISFAEDTDYYICVAPSAQDGFSMVFENEDGSRKITRFSSKNVFLNRSRITDFGTIALGDAFDDNSMAPYLWTQHNPAYTKYAAIAVIADGYKKNEIEQFKADANTGLTALFNTEPYKTYKDYFNVWVMPVASNESGARIADGTLEEQNRDCYFQSSWNTTSYDGMRANDARVFQFVNNYCPDIINGSRTIDKVPILIIINDTRYGGISWNWTDGNTYCMAPKTYNGDPLLWSYPAQEAQSVTATPSEGLHTVTNEEREAIKSPFTGNWTNVLIHEFGGHSVGKLGDEYWYPGQASQTYSPIAQHSWPVPMRLNSSATYVEDDTPWSILFDSENESKMNTKSGLYAQRIGVFQGSNVSTFNRWRSEKVSCMIDNRPYFSTWQRYLIVQRIRSLAGLTELGFDSFLENDNPLDPVRDIVSSSAPLPVGVSDNVPARSVPMLPPPREVEGSPEF